MTEHLEFAIVCDGSNLFIEVDGVGRIAKRENLKWVSLIPGWSVDSPLDHATISITYRPPTARRRKLRGLR
jgi:hypothetical protein